jgi:hypothetical protein
MTRPQWMQRGASADGEGEASADADRGEREPGDVGSPSPGRDVSAERDAALVGEPAVVRSW